METVNLTEHPQIQSGSELLAAMETEIKGTKDGSLPLEQGKLVEKMRRGQVRVWEVALAAWRLDMGAQQMKQKRVPRLIAQLGLLPATVTAELPEPVKEPEKKAEEEKLN